MRVLKVEIEGTTTSFRHPFMHVVQPTLTMPPPATIYGHIASVFGGSIPAGDGANLKVAYCFQFSTKMVDIEKVFMIEPVSKSGDWMTRGTPNIMRREVLFDIRLVLYLNKPDWREYFLSPLNAVFLGRSQDLCEYANIEVIDLVQSPGAYFEHTLLPREMLHVVGGGTILTLPCNFSDPLKRTGVNYITRLFLDRPALVHQGGPYWVDPGSPEIDGRRRGLHFISFGEGE